MNIDIVMSMNKMITITSKGQTTLPAAMRSKLGLDNTGGVLQAHFNERKGELVISKPDSVAELSKRVSSYIMPGTKPVVDVGEYYRAHRKTRG